MNGPSRSTHVGTGRSRGAFHLRHAVNFGPYSCWTLHGGIACSFLPPLCGATEHLIMMSCCCGGQTHSGMLNSCAKFGANRCSGFCDINFSYYQRPLEGKVRKFWSIVSQSYAEHMFKIWCGQVVFWARYVRFRVQLASYPKVIVNNLRNYCDRNVNRITCGQVGLQIVCAKIDADWSKTLGGVLKSRFFAFCDVAKKNCRKNGRSLCQLIQNYPLNMMI